MQILEEIMKFCGGGGGRRGNVSSAPPKQPQSNTDDILLLSVGTLSFSMSCCLYDHRALENPVSITGEENVLSYEMQQHLHVEEHVLQRNTV